ncbi:hypothetical protein RK885_02055, partial [Streptococcus pneumoniae]|nr:hypothetical protein [Streptococcus pneumoniae]MDT6168287.1 hypothetical protein [Streptococcus pneumoniae]
KKHPLGEKRNHPGSKLRQGFWMVFRFGVNNWGVNHFIIKRILSNFSSPDNMRYFNFKDFLTSFFYFTTSS